ncbi:MAG TPA: hypothetical protein DIC42_03630 [Holosporales bacterium]|nr:hypothetical protein [Holosporales bacterium]
MKKYRFKTSQFIEIFPYYTYDDLFPFNDELPPLSKRLPAKSCYQEFNISAFNHYLDENEYDEKMITYDYFNREKYYYCVNKRKYFHKKTQQLWEYYKKLENSFLNFFDFLYKEDVYMILANRYLVEFTSKQEYFRHCLYGIRERADNLKTRTFIVPNLGIMVSSAWDHKHIIHASKKHYKKDAFEKIVKDAGLFILA